MQQDKEKPVIQEIIVVEGKDDVAAVKVAVEAECIITHGHGIREATLAQIEEAERRRGVIILTDPDYAGKRIRRIVQERVPRARHAHLPRAKALRGDDIGVENASPEDIREALFRARATLTTRRTEFSHADLLAHGLDAAEGARARRVMLAEALGLGYGNAKQMLARLNDFDISRDEFETAMARIHQVRGEA